MVGGADFSLSAAQGRPRTRVCRPEDGRRKIGDRTRRKLASPDRWSLCLRHVRHGKYSTQKTLRLGVSAVRPGKHDVLDSRFPGGEVPPYPMFPAWSPERSNSHGTRHPLGIRFHPS